MESNKYLPTVAMDLRAGDRVPNLLTTSELKNMGAMRPLNNTYMEVADSHDDALTVTACRRSATPECVDVEAVDAHGSTYVRAVARTAVVLIEVDDEDDSERRAFAGGWNL